MTNVARGLFAVENAAWRRNPDGPLGSRWRMIVTTAQVVDRDLVPLGELGAAHDLAMVYGDWTADIKALAKILRVEYCQI